jgi:hypothetical protein
MVFACPYATSPKPLRATALLGDARENYFFTKLLSRAAHRVL